jgi:hypothetical protein
MYFIVSEVKLTRPVLLPSSRSFRSDNFPLLNFHTAINMVLCTSRSGTGHNNVVDQDSEVGVHNDVTHVTDTSTP